MKSPQPPLYIRKVRGMGRGVFAGRPFRKGEVIEVCPVLVMSAAMTDRCKGEALERYLFAWAGKETPTAVALGYGSLYNHSPEPNARFTTRVGRGEIVFRAARDIAAGEQILVDYEWEEGEFDIPPAGPRSGSA